MELKEQTIARKGKPQRIKEQIVTILSKEEEKPAYIKEYKNPLQEQLSEIQQANEEIKNKLNELQDVPRRTIAPKEEINELNQSIKPNSLEAKVLQSREAVKKKKEEDQRLIEKGLKKPRYDENSQPNPQKCRYSPYSFHRFARCHKEKLKNGSIAMILRCRYCIEFQQVIIHFTKQSTGRYIAEKEVLPVNETIGGI